MTNEELTFYHWWRDGAAAKADRVEHGRLVADHAIRVDEADLDGVVLRSVTESLSVAIAGPGDVAGLSPGAVTRRYPTPGTTDHETNRLPHIEFADPQVPWRHSPVVAPSSASDLTPWVALIVALDDASEIEPAGVTLGETVALLPPVTADLDPDTLHRWAHVQEDTNGIALGRVLCCRRFPAGLPPGASMVALVVPAFVLDDGGAVRPAFTPGEATAPLPVYDSWRFRTSASPGDFRTLARRLRPGDAPPTTGSAPVTYARLADTPAVEARGALAPAGGTAQVVDPAVVADLDQLRRLGSTDDDGRPIVGLPSLGGPWLNRDATWASALNRDPRTRGVAGVGRRSAIALQDQLTADVAEHIGAVDEANQRIRHLAAGVSAARSLWNRFLPPSDEEQLLLFGPSLSRIMTPTGSVQHRLASGHRPTGTAFFSSAARRALRRGPARTHRADPGATDAAGLVGAANTCPKPPATPVGPLTDEEHLPDEVRELLALWREDPEPIFEASYMVDLVDSLQFSWVSATEARRLTALRVRVLGQIDDVNADDPSLLLAVLILTAGALPDEENEEFRARALADGGPWVCFMEFDLGTDGLWRCLEEHGILRPDTPFVPFPPYRRHPEQPPCDPIDPSALVADLRHAFDPTVEKPRAAVRIYSTITGAEPDPGFLPVEPCPSLPRPAWELLANQDAEWLLPGIGQLTQDIVIGLETNQRFVEACLVGINQQILGELRWRATTIGASCTPMRRWWGRVDPETGAELPDISGIASWTPDTQLGGHNPSSSAPDAVVLFKGDLFHRYPTTLVYLTPADANWTPPAQDRDRTADSYPTFRGTIGADVSFFGFGGKSIADLRSSWVVLEEPPAGYSFRAQPPQTGAAQTARHLFAVPVRVLIRGDKVIPGAGP